MYLPQRRRVNKKKLAIGIIYKSRSSTAEISFILQRFVFSVFFMTINIIHV